VSTILVHPSPFEYTFRRSRAGAVFTLNVHELKWGLEVRQHPPRIRLLEDAKDSGPTLCELLDPWPGAPRYWPPEWEPGQPANPIH
jgi:hypothetical protein